MEMLEGRMDSQIRVLPGRIDQLAQRMGERNA